MDKEKKKKRKVVILDKAGSTRIQNLANTYLLVYKNERKIE